MVDNSDNSELASEFELQPLSRKTATLPGDSSSGDKWSESSSCSSSWKKKLAYKDKLSYSSTWRKRSILRWSIIQA